MVAAGSRLDLTANDGTALRYRAWEPEGARGSVLVVHGLGEHSGRYAELAAALGAQGVAMYAPDLRGHGLSEGRRGHVRDFEEYLLDLDVALDAVRGRTAGRPIVLLGHSLGGLIALRYAETRPGASLAGLVLSAPQLAIARPPPAWLRGVADVLAVVAPALPLPNGLDAGDLSHDAAEVAAYRDDPLVHDRITPGLFRAMRRAMPAAAAEVDAVSVPAALVVIPGADPIVRPDVTRSVAGRLDTRLPTEVVEYPEMYHEPMHERDRTSVLDDLVRWVLPRIA